MAEVRVERDGAGVARVVLDDPETRNGMTLDQWRQLAAALREIGERHDDRVVVLTGAGGTFCSGAHLAAGGGAPAPVSPLARMDVVNEACRLLHHLRQPTIAAVSGHAVGAGFSLALACDLVVAERGAKLSAMFVRRGFSIDCGGSWSLVNRVGLHRAKELALLGRMLSGDDAAALGVVNRVVDDGGLDDAIAAWTSELLALPPVALAQNKRLIDQATAGDYDQALVREAAAQQLNSTTDDTREAISAFLDRREPYYRGH